MEEEKVPDKQVTEIAEENLDGLQNVKIKYDETETEIPDLLEQLLEQELTPKFWENSYEQYPPTENPVRKEIRRALKKINTKYTKMINNKLKIKNQYKRLSTRKKQEFKKNLAQERTKY